MNHVVTSFEKALFSYKSNHPYYIYAPPLKLHSAGIAALHRLCHLLNLSGNLAYIATQRSLLGILGHPLVSTHPLLLTPEITQETAEQHIRMGKRPIAIYPDTVEGNPLGCPVVVRYLLNYPGALGGPTKFDKNECIFSYSKKIAQRAESPQNVLFIPVSDPKLFKLGDSSQVRRGTCYYAAKFKHHYGGQVGPEVDGAFEITRDLPLSLSKKGLASLFARSELLLCYENSAIAIEAALCGCPTAYVPNEHFTELIGDEELGRSGFAWGIEPDQINHAKATVGQFRERYLKLINDLPAKIEAFVSATQDKADTCSDSLMRPKGLPVMIGSELGYFHVMARYAKHGRWVFAKLHTKGFKGTLVSLFQVSIRTLTFGRFFPKTTRPENEAC